MSVSWDDVLDPLPAPRRLITPRRILAAAALVAGALVVGFAVWLLTSDPLQRGGLTGAPGGTAQRSSVVTGVGDTLYIVSAGREGTFELGFDLTNTGRLPLAVQGLKGPSSFTLSGMARYPTFEGPDRRSPGEIMPFEPVTIDPGDSRFLVFRLEIAGEEVCSSPGATSQHGDPRLRYRMLGLVPRTAAVDVPFTVVTVCGDTLPPGYDWLDAQAR